MNVELEYGKTGVEIELPDEANSTIVEPTYVPGLPDQAAALRTALQKPIASLPLRDLVEHADEVGIAFSDITRPTPNDLMLPILLEDCVMCRERRSRCSTAPARIAPIRRMSFAPC